MKSKSLILSLAILFVPIDHVFAHEGMNHDEGMEPQDHQSPSVPETKAVEVGNKICPVSGDKVGEMGEVIKYEYNGKIYNFCCKACIKDFKKDPGKYSKIAEEEIAREKTTDQEHKETNEDQSTHDHSGHKHE